jgi:putative phosphoesterase
MRIGVVGDTHDRMTNVERIVALFRAAEVERVVHTGDITQPQVLARLATLDVPVLAVFGNNDRAARHLLLEEARRLDVEIADPPQSFVWAERRILVVHDPEELPATLPDEGLDLILHGHTHRHRCERLGPTWVFNPGECAGLRPGGNAVGLVDLVELETSLLRF